MFQIIKILLLNSKKRIKVILNYSKNTKFNVNSKNRMESQKYMNREVKVTKIN